MTALEGNGELVAVVVTGQCKAFCVGLDKDLLRRAFDDMDYFRDVIRRYNGILNRIEELPMPTIAAVNGYARAGGIELALAEIKRILEALEFGVEEIEAGAPEATAPADTLFEDMPLVAEIRERYGAEVVDEKEVKAQGEENP